MRNLWIQTDSGKQGALSLIDADTRKAPESKEGSQLTIHLGAFDHDRPLDLSVFDRVDLRVLGVQAEVLANVSVDSANFTNSQVSLSGWNARTEVNAEFALTSTDMTYDLGDLVESVDLWMMVAGYTGDEETALGAGTLTLWSLTENPNESTGSGNSTEYASISYVDAADALKANLASPTFTGVPRGPTATNGNSSTMLATTAFVATAVAAVGDTHTQNTDTQLANGTGDETSAAEIRTHLDDATKHRQINDAGNGTTVLWSSDKVIDYVANATGSLGNISSLNLNGNVSTALRGDGTFAAIGNVSELSLNGNASMVLRGDGSFAEAGNGSGNISSLNLNGNVSTALRGDGSFAAIGNVSELSLNGNVSTALRGDGSFAAIGNVSALSLNGNVSTALRGDGSFAAIGNVSALSLNGNGSTVLLGNGTFGVGGNGSSTRTGVYRNMWIGSGAQIARITNGATAATVELATNDVMMDFFDFGNGTDTATQFAAAMPDEWDQGVVKAKVYWTAAGGTGGVAFGVRAMAVSDDDPLDVALSGATEVVVTDNFIAANDCHVTSATGNITIGGTPALGDLVIWEVTRRTGNASDTLGNTSRCIGLSVQYKESSTEPSAW